MMDEYARNFSDLSHPTIVSSNGAFAEYKLPEDKTNWKGLGLGSTVIIEDKRDGKTISRREF